MLLGEIARATVVLPEPLPPNAVVMNCDVEVRNNIKKAIKHLRIVLPGEEDRGQHGVSVLTPIGAALVGLSEGAQSSGAHLQGIGAALRCSACAIELSKIGP